MNDSNQDSLRAVNNPKFYSRFKWLGLGALLFSGYCYYDGDVNYPNQKERGEAYLEMAQETLSEEDRVEIMAHGHGEKGVYLALVKRAKEDVDLSNDWAALTKEKGWPTAPPAKLRGDGDIAGQFVMSGLTALAGAWMLLTVWRSSGRWVELTKEGTIDTSWGQTFPVESVTQIDKRQWRDKGIARVKYDHEGRKSRFIVDDYKYDRPVMDEILRRIEMAIDADKITGGPTEAATAAAEASVETIAQADDLDAGTATV